MAQTENKNSFFLLDVKISEKKRNNVHIERLNNSVNLVLRKIEVNR
jgi:hypothetical protein